MTGFMVTSSNLSTATSYTVWVHLHGWASLTINEVTGIVTWNSDWLDGHYMWPRTGLLEGKSLTAFLCDCDPSYICNKLFLGQVTHERDKQATFIRLQQEVLRLRRDASITSVEARQAWDDISNVSASEFNIDSPLDDILPQPIHEYLVHTETYPHKITRTVLLPAVLEMVRSGLTEPKRMA